MPSASPLRPFAAAILALSALALGGCGTVSTIAMSEDARAHLHVVSVDPQVKLPADITYMGPGQAAALILGGPLVGSVIANKTAEGPKGQLLAEMRDNHIELGNLLAAEFARQTSAAGTTKFVVGDAPADARVELTVVAYGLMHAQPLGSTLYPLITVTAVMKAPDGQVVWQATDVARPTSSENKEGHTFDDYAHDPELLRAAFVAGSGIVSHMLTDNLMGREKPQNVPGVQR